MKLSLECFTFVVKIHPEAVVDDGCRQHEEEGGEARENDRSLAKWHFYPVLISRNSRGRWNDNRGLHRNFKSISGFFQDRSLNFSTSTLLFYSRRFQFGKPRSFLGLSSYSILRSMNARVLSIDRHWLKRPPKTLNARKFRCHLTKLTFLSDDKFAFIDR